jgi:hypothetical protein
MSTATLDRSRLRKQLANPFTLPTGAVAHFRAEGS